MASTVSVVIPCKNYGAFLKDCLDSVLSQTLPPHEILVVDDGSTDHTPDLVKEYGSAVSYLRVEGRGAYGARNDSLEHLSGSYFLNVDADNRLDPHFIERCCRLLDAAPADVGYIYTQRRMFGEKTGVSSFPAFDPQALLLTNYVDMCSLIRMDLVKQYRFDERFNRGQGDHAFFLGLLADGITGQRLDEPLLHYRVHSGSVSQRFSRRYDQMEVCRMIIDTFPGLYSRELANQAMESARNRTLVSIISNRHPEAPFAQRWKDLCCFLRAQPLHGELLRQILYLVAPGRVAS